MCRLQFFNTVRVTDSAARYSGSVSNSDSDSNSVSDSDNDSDSFSTLVNLIDIYTLKRKYQILLIICYL